MTRTLLITGAGRGIGRKLAEHYLGEGASVIVTARDVSAVSDLVSAGAEAHSLEVTDQAQIAALKSAIGNRPIDVLINNAGVIGGPGPQKLGDLIQEDWEATIRTNVFAPFRITEALADNVLASDEKKFIVISSVMGSISSNQASDKIIYRSSKAAINMVWKGIHNDLSSKGAIVVPLHPGWVSTDMGGAAAPVTPSDSANGLARVIDGLTQADSARLFDYQGAEIDW